MFEVQVVEPVDSERKLCRWKSEVIIVSSESWRGREKMGSRVQAKTRPSGKGGRSITPGACHDSVLTKHEGAQTPPHASAGSRCIYISRTNSSAQVGVLVNDTHLQGPITHLQSHPLARPAPRSTALSLALAGKLHRVWKPGVLLVGEGKKEASSAVREKRHVRIQSHSLAFEGRPRGYKFQIRCN